MGEDLREKRDYSFRGRLSLLHGWRRPRATKSLLSALADEARKGEEIILFFFLGGRIPVQGPLAAKGEEKVDGATKKKWRFFFYSHLTRRKVGGGYLPLEAPHGRCGSGVKEEKGPPHARSLTEKKEEGDLNCQAFILRSGLPPRTPAIIRNYSSVSFQATRPRCSSTSQS